MAKQADIELKHANDELEDRIRKRTAQLQAREAQMRAILETSNRYLWLMDPGGSVQYANRTALASIRADTSERLDRAFWDTGWFAADPRTQECVRDMFVTACTGSPQQTELSLSLPVGVRILEFNLRPISDSSGEISGVLCEAIDITERRRSEECLRQSQKMEAIGQLTGGVAHDFNNFLTIISSATEILKNPNLLADDRHRYLGVISNTVIRATKLTSQLLAFARRHPVTPVTFDVGKQVESTAQMLQLLLDSQIQVDVDIAEQGCLVRADVGQFETAILNLAVNAGDAMPAGGRLTLRVKRAREIPLLRQHQARAGNFVAISVSDTGSGIPTNLLEKVFEPFFTTKQVGKGTGLGLSQVFGFSKQSGGDIEVTSQKGQGSTFTVYLPLANGVKGDVPVSVAQSS
jgi:PAS domain S-box-containing protein